MKKEIILVDKNDKQIGIGEKMQVHKEGLLHRAFSVFIFNNKNELLLQKRAKSKYHCGGLWTNTCCSHPKPNEDTTSAAHARLVEEMGFDCPIKEIFSFMYKAKFNNNLYEHEFDHVFFGNYDKNPIPKKLEVEDWKWIDLNTLKKDLQINPDNYTFWFKECVGKVFSFLEK